MLKSFALDTKVSSLTDKGLAKMKKENEQHVLCCVGSVALAVPFASGGVGGAGEGNRLAIPPMLHLCATHSVSFAAELNPLHGIGGFVTVTHGYIAIVVVDLARI